MNDKELLARADTLVASIGASVIELAEVLEQIKDRQAYRLLSFEDFRSYIRAKTPWTAYRAFDMLATLVKARQMGLRAEALNSRKDLPMLKKCLSSNDKEEARRLLKLPDKEVRKHFQRYTYTSSVKITVTKETYAALDHLRRETGCESVDLVVKLLLDYYKDSEKQKGTLHKQGYFGGA